MACCITLRLFNHVQSHRSTAGGCAVPEKHEIWRYCTQSLFSLNFLFSQSIFSVSYLIAVPSCYCCCVVTVLINAVSTVTLKKVTQMFNYLGEYHV
jgi:hypothetical protein